MRWSSARSVVAITGRHPWPLAYRSHGTPGLAPTWAERPALSRPSDESGLSTAGEIGGC
jgi:hypothetical protein